MRYEDTDEGMPNDGRFPVRCAIRSDPDGINLDWASTLPAYSSTRRMRRKRHHSGVKWEDEDATENASQDSSLRWTVHLYRFVEARGLKLIHN